METFIQIVANDIIKKFGTNLRDITVVFPNKRAGLFMNQQLSAISDRPVWAPKYQTISELFTSLSKYTLCDDIMAICELYDVYASHVDEPETLDRFYGWGEIMLSDFDDIDKHLADTSKLFKNIQEIKELDNSSYLTPEQEKALKNFFKDFSIEGNTQLKERFLKLWNQMGNIYTEFNERIKSKGLLYEGALYKDVINDIDRLFGELYEKKTYIFVGFNVLNEVEKSLF
ncbi:MAG: PD-(D/E)XK nuclease family protein, partial [Paraprevotella sp.]|nr:PD-(D/E)XK nuclease family protein [Paraprevotella sp.]